jgi:hypothetical protein
MTDCWAEAHANVNEALEITQHDRNDKAGNPENNFAHIAACWTGLLMDKLTPGEYITAADTARMMIAMKLCRDSHAPHRDNRVDIHGYALCLDRVEPTSEPAASASVRTEPWTRGFVAIGGTND